MDKLLLAVACLLSLFIIAQAISFISNWRKTNFNKATKKMGMANIVNVANLLVAVLALVMAYFANKDGGRLLDANIEFLKTAGKINDTAKSINQQSVTFLDLSIRTLDGFNKQSKAILDGASQMNERSRAFLEASQGSLENFRNTANELQKVMQSNIDLANKQIEILTATLKREEELLNRKAQIVFYYQGVDLSSRKSTEFFTIDLKPKETNKKLPFSVGNSGKIPLKEPVVIFSVNPISVCIVGSNRQEGCYIHQMAGGVFGSGVLSVFPGAGNDIEIEVKIPDDVNEFQVKLQVSGDGLQGLAFGSSKFKVNRLRQ